MKKNFSKKTILSVICVAGFIFSPCSSSPKRIMRVTDTANTAAAIYESANVELVSGDVEAAGDHLQQAYKLAVSVDDSDLLSRISLSAVIYKLSSNADVGTPENLPFYSYNAKQLLTLSRNYASRSENKDVLLNISEIYEVRIYLAEEKVTVEEMLPKLTAVEGSLSKEPYYLAFLYRTKADVCAFLKDYEAAEKNYLEAAKLHIENRYLYEIGLDYYNAARMSSLAGEKKRAIEEIDNALKYDKDSENTGVIAADYYAYGIILLKGGCTDDEKIRAKAAILWAGDIAEAGGLYDQAKKYRAKAAEIK